MAGLAELTGQTRSKIHRARPLNSFVRFALVMLLALLVGTMFGIWVGFNPSGLSASAYVEQQQIAIRAFNTLLPVMGAACVLLSVILAILSKDDARSRYLLVAAAFLLVVSGLVTRLANQPINAIVMTWSPQAPAANWAALRDQWWQWHIARSIAGIGALVLVVLAVLRSRQVPAK